MEISFSFSYSNLSHEDYGNTQNTHKCSNDFIGLHLLLEEDDAHRNDQDRHDGHERGGDGSGGILDGHEG